MVHDCLRPVAEKDGKDRKQIERLERRAGGGILLRRREAGGREKREYRRGESGEGEHGKIPALRPEQGEPQQQEEGERHLRPGIYGMQKGKGRLPFRQSLAAIGEHDLEHTSRKGENDGCR